MLSFALAFIKQHSHALRSFLGRAQGHANVTTTAPYLNVKDDYLQKLIERRPLALVRN